MAANSITWTNAYMGTKLDLTGYNISFEDNFDRLDVATNSKDAATWYSGAGANFGKATFVGPNSAVSPFEVKDGALNITMQQVDGKWQSGHLQTVNSSGSGFSQSYGYFEVRASLSGGAGAWPAFWLISPATDNRPRVELDVLEAYGGDPKGHHTALHYSQGSQVPDYLGNAAKSDYTGMSQSLFGTGYHTFGTLVTPDWIITYMDGSELTRTKASEYTSAPFYMIVDLAMGNEKPNSSKYGMSIDYIKAYSNPTFTAQSLKGTDGSDHLYGTERGDTLNGGKGADYLYGGKGDDTYYVDHAGDRVYENNGEGTDTVYSSISFDMRGQYIENLIMTGSDNISATGTKFANTITGNSGNNIIDGGLGSDTMIGGAGDDIYYVNTATDVVIEKAGEGYDTIRTSVSLNITGQHIERVELVAAGNFSLSGNSLDNTLVGNANKNIINGGLGADKMIGGGGDDSYYVDNVGDQVVEDVGGGNDTLYSSISLSTTPANVENIRLTGTADLVVKTGAGAQKLYGNSGNNRLDGGAGADRMEGGKGDDIYYVDDIGDVVVEKPGEGTDIVYSSVSFSLAGQHVEKLVLTGTANINATGNGYDNTLNGNAGSNILTGGAGKDILRGGLGNDTLIGDGGNARYADVFVFDQTPSKTNVDTIVDFQGRLDTIELARGAFQGIGAAGVLTADMFEIGTNSTKSTTKILYDDKSGKLYFDADGSGAVQKVLFAEMSNHAVLTHSDFVVA